MSDNPSASAGAANLGSSYATIGFKNDPTGIQAFLKDSTAAISVVKQLDALLAAPRSTRTPSLSVSQAQIATLQRAQISADARVLATRVTGAARVQAAEQARIGKTQAAELAANARIEAARLASETKLQLAAQRAAQGASGPALPRTFAGFTEAGLAQAAGFAAAAVSVEKVTGKIVQLGQESIELAKRAQTIGTAYEAATQRAGIASDGLIKTLKAAARETVTTTDLQASANKALALGVGQNAQQIGDLLAIARQKGKDFGIETGQAFEDITTGLGRLSPRILDNLGIILDETRIYGQYAAAIGKSTDELSDQEKRQALVNELIRSNTDLLAKNATAALDNADMQAQAAARRAEALTRLGKDLVPLQTSAAQTTAAILEGLSGALGEQTQDISANLASTADSYEQYSKRVDAANQSVGIGVQVLVEQLTGIKPPAWLIPFTDQVEKLTPAEYAAARGLEAYGVSAEQAQRQVRGVGDISESINQTIGATYDALVKLEPQLLTLAATSPEAARQIRELIATFQQTGDQAAFERGVQNLSDSLEEQAVKAQYAASATRGKAAADKDAADAAAKNADAQKSLGEAIVDAARQIEQAQQKRADALAELDRDHAKRVAELEQNSRDAAAETARDIAETEAEGADQRAEIVSDTQDRLAKIERDADKRRSDLIRDYNRRQAAEERQYQRERAAAEEDANVSQLQSYSTFIAKLNDLTNHLGRQGQKIRREALAAQQAALAEASQLATIDPEAAAQLLALRRSQITENIQRQQEQQQRARDARRGGSLTPGQVRDQIAEENEAQRQFDEAQAQAIKDGAARKAQQRDEDRQAAKDALDQQLSDLEQNTKDQLAEAQQAGADKLTEFDKQQTKRIAQIRKHGEEQQAAIQKQLNAEQQQYTDKQNEIEDEYTKFLDNLRDQLNDRANELFHPNETQQRLLAEAYHTLGETLGKALLDGINGITGQGIKPPPLTGGGPYGTGTTPLPNTSGSIGARTRGSTVGVRTDPILSDQAIDQVVFGGRESDGYSSLRGGTLHGGVDIATPEGTAVRSPVDGTVVAIASTKEGGNYMIVQAANGDQWYFGHLQRASVRLNTRVRRGQTIARSGATGTAITGPHLHLQLRRGGRVVDPSQTLEQIAGTSSPAGASSGSQTPQSSGGGTITPQSVTAPPRTSTSALDQAVFLNQPTLSRPSTTNAPTAITFGPFAPSIVINGAGASAPEIGAEIDRRIPAWLAQYEAQQQQAIQALRASGERRVI